jgi:hypothetical protein
MDMVSQKPRHYKSSPYHARPVLTNWGVCRLTPALRALPPLRSVRPTASVTPGASTLGLPLPPHSARRRARRTRRDLIAPRPRRRSRTCTGLARGGRSATPVRVQMAPAAARVLFAGARKFLAAARARCSGGVARSRIRWRSETRVCSSPVFPCLATPRPPDSRARAKPAAPRVLFAGARDASRRRCARAWQRWGAFFHARNGEAASFSRELPLSESLRSPRINRRRLPRGMCAGDWNDALSDFVRA